jgi:hypothetical protein
MLTKLYDYQYFATIRTTFVSTNSDDIRSSYPSHDIVASVSWLFRHALSGAALPKEKCPGLPGQFSLEESR